MGENQIKIEDAFTDILFYNYTLSKENVIGGYRNCINIPQVKDKIILNKKYYTVLSKFFDYDKKVVHIVVARD